MRTPPPIPVSKGCERQQERARTSCCSSAIFLPACSVCVCPDFQPARSVFVLTVASFLHSRRKFRNPLQAGTGSERCNQTRTPIHPSRRSDPSPPLPGVCPGIPYRSLSHSPCLSCSRSLCLLSLSLSAQMARSSLSTLTQPPPRTPSRPPEAAQHGIMDL